MMSRILLLLTVALMAAACGRASVSAIKIIGGRPVTEHRPWFVQLMSSDTSSDGFCGGTLIAPRIVVTAAHCIDAATTKTLHVALGFEDGVNLNVNHPVKVVGLVVHPSYSPSELKNDIAVLYLESYDGVQFERPVRPIDYAKDPSLPERIQQSAIVVGLGNTTSVGSLFDGVVREVEVPFIDMARCTEIYTDAGEKQICAGDMVNGGRDSCQGDSGGPMLAKNQRGDLELVGIVSYGNGCAQKNGPGIYTRVGSHRSFIEGAIRDLTETRDTGREDEVRRLLTTRCTAQFGHIPFSKDSSDNNKRTTIYSVDLKTFSVSRSESLISGLKIDECDVIVDKMKIHAEWVVPKTANNGQTTKVSVRVTVNDAEYYVSAPQRLVYMQDHLICSTSVGTISLADQRQVTYVTYKDVLYGLGEHADQPGDNQTTWGCSIDDASLEVYEISGTDGSIHDLAARIHHKSIGTISVKLVRFDQDLNVAARLDFEDGVRGRLTIMNDSSEDLFTFKITCPQEFKIKLGSDNYRSAEPAPQGAGYQIIIDSAIDQEGAIRGGSSLTLGFDSSMASGVGTCLINDVIPVSLNH